MSHQADSARERGALVLVPNALDFGAAAPRDLRDELPLAVIERAARIVHWRVEDAKTARAFLKRVHAIVPLVRALQELDVAELPRTDGRVVSAADRPDWDVLLAPAATGADVGLLAEAGLPAVADPGATLVAAAHRLGIRVETLPGPSSLMLALAGSGLDGQHFAFVGYLPVKPEPRAAKIRELDELSRRKQQTQIAIETPYRNATLLGALIEHLQPATRLSVACGIGWPGGWQKTMPVAQWRQAGVSIDNRVPAIFVWQAR